MKRVASSIDPTTHPVAFLNQFLTWVIPFTFGFGSLGMLAAIFFRDRGMMITALALFLYGLLLFSTRRRLLLRGNWGRTLVWLCLGMLGATLIVAVAQISLLPTLIVTPLLAVMVVLPYTSLRLVQRLLLLCWGVAVMVMFLGMVLPDTTTLPPWFSGGFQIGALATAYGVVLLLLSQFSRRLTEILAQSRAAEERYALAARGANDGLWDWDLEAQQIYVSPRWKEMVGLPEAARLSPREFEDRIHPADRPRVRSELDAHIAGATPYFQSEYRILHEDGVYRWMACRGAAVYNDQGRATRIAGSQRDITDHQAIQAQLLHAAFHDALTHLPNRALFLERLRQAGAAAADGNVPHFAVLFLDLDRFKMLNDSLGHSAGDQVLVIVAERLRSILRPSDMVARLGGDEFTILLTGLTHPVEAQPVVERILAVLEQPFTVRGRDIFLTASLGVVVSQQGYDDPEAFLRDADIAMYRAKASGRARYVLFDQTMHRDVLALLQMETALHHAIERQELQVLFQPIISLRSGHIRGFEALLRWTHPELGSVPPMKFIPLAEESGLIGSLSWWVLRVACRQLREWQGLDAVTPLTLNVNWSRHLLTLPNMVEQILAVLEETGLAPHHLQLEITESLLRGPSDEAGEVLTQLRAAGVQLQIDDFGTGYSSLSTLHTFPIHALKIDRSFVSRLGVEGDTLEIVQAIVTLAHNLGLDVVAEGIEREEQLAQLRLLGCDQGQGYLFAHPLDPCGVKELLARAPQW